MQFLLVAQDHPGELSKRLAVRAEHMAGIKRGKQEGYIIDGGAILNDAGEMCGSAMILEFADRAGLDTYIASEIYQREGVWGALTIQEIRRIDWSVLLDA